MPDEGAQKLQNLLEGKRLKDELREARRLGRWEFQNDEEEQEKRESWKGTPEWKVVEPLLRLHGLFSDEESSPRPWVPPEARHAFEKRILRHLPRPATVTADDLLDAFERHLMVAEAEFEEAYPLFAKTVIPVSCVEQGRWRHVGRDFRPGTVSPSRMRARKGRDVHLSLRARGRHESDQAGVWDEVQEELADLGAASPTMAMHDAVRHRERDLAAYRDALPYPDGARGVFVAVGDRFAAVDLFDRAATLRKVWPRLVTGYAMDALGRRDRKERAFQPKGPKAILERLGQVACEPYPSPGLGEDLRFAAEDLTGHALVVDGACITLSAFPNDAGGASGRDPDTEGPSGPRIQPPSRRGR